MAKAPKGPKVALDCEIKGPSMPNFISFGFCLHAVLSAPVIRF